MNTTPGSFAKIIGEEAINKTKNTLWQRINSSIIESPRKSRSMFDKNLKQDSCKNSPMLTSKRRTMEMFLHKLKNKTMPKRAHNPRKSYQGERTSLLPGRILKDLNIITKKVKSRDSTTHNFLRKKYERFRLSQKSQSKARRKSKSPGKIVTQRPEKLFIPNYKEYLEKAQRHQEAKKLQRTKNEEKQRLSFIDDVVNNTALLKDSNFSGWDRYSIDINGKMALLRETMITQMKGIQKISQVRQLKNKKKIIIPKTLKRMNTKFGIPKKLPVMTTLGMDDEGISKSNRTKKAGNPFSTRFLAEKKPVSVATTPLKARLKEKVPLEQPDDQVQLKFSVSGHTFTKMFYPKRKRLSIFDDGTKKVYFEDEA
ncbi:unnamed protein product [Moneuplotes crassus]|uniref:Uncharacterized protein n=1 Tax=Euplotes crassus TaxID=5936 RepID=A0AAD1UQK4_EUPCR|nr:unnamed protein product [Moneuplotes crassus]